MKEFGLTAGETVQGVVAAKEASTVEGTVGSVGAVGGLGQNKVG
jgi:hypothetical protein